MFMLREKKRSDLRYTKKKCINNFSLNNQTQILKNENHDVTLLLFIMNRVF